MIGIIAAVTSNGIIGVDDKLPFNYPEDMAHFKKTTSNSVVIMGKNTFNSIGKPLPNRHNIVVSTTLHLDNPMLQICKSFEDAISLSKSISNNIWIIGGSSIYEQSMMYADKILLTITTDIVNSHNCIRFPWINPLIFKVLSVSKFSNANLKLVSYEKII